MTPTGNTNLVGWDRLSLFHTHTVTHTNILRAHAHTHTHTHTHTQTQQVSIKWWSCYLSPNLPGYSNAMLNHIIIIHDTHSMLTLSATFPPCFSISPSSAWMREDLPAPTWPTTATNWPGFTSRLTLCDVQWALKYKLLLLLHWKAW